VIHKRTPVRRPPQTLPRQNQCELHLTTSPWTKTQPEHKRSPNVAFSYRTRRTMPRHLAQWRRGPRRIDHREDHAQRDKAAVLTQR
jgi:hypothetical protein